MDTDRALLSASRKGGPAVLRHARWRSSAALVAVAASALVSASGCPRPEPRRRVLRIAAAADLRPALDSVVEGFRRGNPAVEVSPTYGSSGGFYEQIRSGAPFDVFLSANLDYPRRLLQAKIGASDSLFLYAVGSIAVWVRVDSGLDPATVLRNRSLRKLAIANPEHAPYGRAALAALRSLGVYDALRDKLVLGENVSQALEFARSGAADAAIVAHSLVSAPALNGVGRYWEIPAASYPRMDQAGLIVADSAEARAFCSFLVSPEARRTIVQFGFAAPGVR